MGWGIGLSDTDGGTDGDSRVVPLEKPLVSRRPSGLGRWEFRCSGTPDSELVEERLGTGTFRMT